MMQICEWLCLFFSVLLIFIGLIVRLFIRYTVKEVGGNGVSLIAKVVATALPQLKIPISISKDIRAG
jgi:hypothetical protein